MQYNIILLGLKFTKCADCAVPTNVQPKKGLTQFLIIKTNEDWVKKLPAARGKGIGSEVSSTYSANVIDFVTKIMHF